LFIEATAKANIQTKAKEKLPTNLDSQDSAPAQGEPPQDFQQGTSCPICFKAHQRSWFLILHLIKNHDKSMVEARSMTSIDGKESNPAARKLYTTANS
jgi:hypothetical protein